MTTLLACLVLLVVLVGAGFYVVHYFKSEAVHSASLDQRDSTLRVEQSQVDAMQAAAAEERAKSAAEFDAKAASATTASGASDLLRSQFPG